MIPAAKTNVHGEIAASEITVPRNSARAPSLSDDAAAKLCVQDAARAEMWMDSKQWPLGWRETDILYQSPRSMAQFEASGVMRANVSRYTVAKHVNSLVPTMMSGIFYDDPPFVIRPRPGTTQATVRAKTALLAALLDEMEFKGECEAGMFSQCLNGTGIWKYGWSVTQRIEKKLVRAQAVPKVKLPFGGERSIATQESDELLVREEKVTRSRPWFEYCQLGTVLVDPGWRRGNKIHKAGYVCHVMYLNFYDLRELRGQEGYTIPEDDELKAWFTPAQEFAQPPSGVEQGQTANGAVHHAERRDFETSEDPLARELRVVERTDNHRVITMVQDKFLIRHEQHGFRRINFFSANWWDIQNAGYGLGVGKLIGADQRVEAGGLNAALDILAFGANPQVLRKMGSNAPTQHIRQRLGGIVDVETGPDGDVRKALAYMEQPKIPPEIWEVIQNAKQASESTSGADEAFSQGSMPQRGSSIGRTATGAGNIASAQANRIQGPVGRFVENVFIPFLYELDDMIQERMPVAEIRQILADELGEAEEVDMKNLLEGRLKYEVLAGAHLAAKKAMAQALPLMIQIFENPHLLQSLNSTGWTVDTKELFDMMCEMSEWKNNREVVRRMTPQEQEMYQQQQGATQQAQKQKGEIAKIAAQHAATQAEIDQKGEAHMATKLTESALDRAQAYIERQQAERAEAAQGLAPTEPPQFFSASQ